MAQSKDANGQPRDSSVKMVLSYAACSCSFLRRDDAERTKVVVSVVGVFDEVVAAEDVPDEEDAEDDKGKDSSSLGFE